MQDHPSQHCEEHTCQCAEELEPVEGHPHPDPPVEAGDGDEETPVLVPVGEDETESEP